VDLVHFYNGHFICSGTIKCWLSPLFHWCVHILKQTCARRQRCRRPGRRRPSPWWHCKHETTTLAWRILAILSFVNYFWDTVYNTNAPNETLNLTKKWTKYKRWARWFRKIMRDDEWPQYNIVLSHANMSHRLREILNLTNAVKIKPRPIPSYSG